MTHDDDDFDNGCTRCHGLGIIRPGVWERCPDCAAHRRPVDPEMLPLLRGGQGRSADDVRAASISVAISLVGLALLALLLWWSS